MRSLLLILLFIINISIQQNPDSSNSLLSAIRSSLFGALQQSDEALPAQRISERNMNPFLNSFLESFSLMTQAFSTIHGPNICSREISYFGEPGDEGSGECSDFNDAHVCTTKLPNGKVTRRIQECCPGFTTDDIHNGCQQVITGEQLASFGISSYSNPITIFYTKPEEKSYILRGVLNFYDNGDKHVFTTQNNEKFAIRYIERKFHSKDTYLNCAITKKTLKTSNSEVIQFEGRLEPAAENVLDIIETNPELSIFYKLLGTELQSFLREEAKESTVFAFTNEAFRKLSNSTRNRLMGENNSAATCALELMKCHISTEESYCDSRLPETIRSINNKTFEIQKTPTLKIDNATIVNPSVFALNGIVHIIDQILVEEDYLSWKDTLRRFNPKLADALEIRNLSSPIAIFVPPVDSEIKNVENYIVSANIPTSFKDQGSVTTNMGSKIFTGPNSEDGPKFFSVLVTKKQQELYELGQIGCSRFISQPVLACNTVFHFIDKPLPLVTQSIDEFLASRDDLSIFYGFWKTFEEPLTRITVLVPHNDAFSPTLLQEIRRSQDSINSFVKRHIIKSTLCSFEIEKDTKDEELRTTHFHSIDNDVLTPTSGNGFAGINGARIRETEIILTNGVVHILENVVGITEKRTTSPIRSKFTFVSHIS